MKSFITCIAPTTFALLLATVSVNAMDDHTLLTGITLDQLELRDTEEGTATAWDGQLWLGDDLNRLQLNSEGEFLHSDSNTEEAELQLLYSRAVSAYWDFHAGWRGDLQPTPERHWLALGMAGLAPYFVDVNATLFLGNEDRSALRLELEYELLFTQRLALVPELELNAYGRNDPETGTGAGLSDLETGLRLRYEITREFAPYVGVHYWKQYGNTADFSEADGEDSDGVAAVAGLHIWF
ncbi:MAG TPA: copper resistance protein B [Dongiaceae bacterium]|nr:copper resistance protein B [Dongiaceae bacterium]